MKEGRLNSISMELVSWMLSGQEGTISYVCMDSKDAKTVYDEAVSIFKSIMAKIKWEGISCENDKE